LKTGIGKTGVSLRYHSKEEYKQLSDDQKKELKIFREENRNKRKHGKPEVKGGSKHQKQQFNKQLISALKELSEPIEEEKSDDVKSMLVSALEEIMSVDVKQVTLPLPPAATQPAKPSSSCLNSIIKRLRQNK